MTIVITGANRGLGYATARELAADPSRTLVLAGRDLDTLEAAALRIRASREATTGTGDLVPMQIDLADLASVRAFAAEFKARDLPPLTTIICNAGIARSDVSGRSADGYELTFAVNHLGHFLMVNLLLDSLQPPARILFVSSGRHDPDHAGGPMEGPRYVKAEWLAYPERDPELKEEEPSSGDRAYATSKLCNVLCTYELARRLEASELSTPERPITVNAFDPGLVAGTDLARHRKPLMRFVWYKVLPLLSRMMGFGRSVEQSGADLAYLATAPELTNVTGKYFSGREMKASSADSYDRSKATDLWEMSVELSGLRPAESPLLERSELDDTASE